MISTKRLQFKDFGFVTDFTIIKYCQHFVTCNSIKERNHHALQYNLTARFINFIIHFYNISAIVRAVTIIVKHYLKYHPGADLGFTEGRG